MQVNHKIQEGVGQGGCLPADMKARIAKVQQTAYLKRIKAMKTADYLDALRELGDIDITDKTVARVQDCGLWTAYLMDSGLEHIKVLKTYNCGFRLCPRCAWIKSKRMATKLATVVEYLRGEGYVFLFLTLTVVNCKREELRSTLKMMADAWAKLRRRGAFEAVDGFFRKLEVTYNKKSDTFHPHYHVMLAVKPSYFKKAYVKRARWLQLWQECTGDSRIIIVDIRRMKDTFRDVLELSKYQAKDAEYLEDDMSVIGDLYKGIKGTKETFAGGVVKDAFQLYDQQDDDGISVLLKKVRGEDAHIEYLFQLIGKWAAAHGRYDWEVRQYMGEYDNSMIDELGDGLDE